MSESPKGSPLVLDVSSLPRHALGLRSSLWWGTVLLIAIESTCFAVLLNAYFYVRNNFREWPPDEHLRRLPGTISLLVLLLTLVPTIAYRRAACAHDLTRTRRALLLATIVSFASVAVRAWEIHAVPFLWTGSAYASVVWGSLGMHTLEIVTGSVESAFLCVVLWRRRLELKTFEDVEAGALFWFFSVLVWLPFAVVFYLDGLLS
jgi:heme/copper-type cytochrome/quinol oxidase subunit 3